VKFILLTLRKRTHRFWLGSFNRCFGSFHTRNDKLINGVLVDF